MAKTAISGGDLTILRGNQSIPDLSLFVTPLQSVVTGEITAIPNRYPTTSLTISWDGATTDVSTGQMVRITDGDTIKAYAVVRKDVSGSTLYISETPLGAYGYATMIENPILVGDTVTIYNHRPLWGMYSRIDAKTKTFYKMWDVAYSSQNEGNIPIANAGAWQAAKLADGETTARFTLPRGGVNTSFVLGSSNPSYLWDLPAGVSLLADYNLNDDVIEVDVEAGNYLVSLTVTKSGNTHTAYLWLFVSDGSNHLSVTNAVSLPQSDNQSRKGREMAFTVYGDNLQDVIYPGAGFMLREWPHYDGGELSEGVGIDSFIGYITDISFSNNGNIGSATFKVESPMIYANRIAQPPQSLEEVSEAANWIQCESVLSNPCGFAYYLIRWHTPALLEMHDFDAEDYTTPRCKYLKCNGARNLGANLDVVAGYLAGNIGSASDGTTVLRPNPLYMGQTPRDAVPTILTFQEQDIAAPLDYGRRMISTYAEARGGAFAYGGSGKPKAWYVGRRWGQGSGAADMKELIVSATAGVAEAKATIGHFYAEQNAEIEEIALGLTLNIDVLDPANMLWTAFTIGATYDPYGLGFTSNRLLPNTIEREWSLDNGNIRKLIKVRSQGETFGQAGEELPIGANTNMNGWSPGTPVIWQPHTSGGMFGGDQAMPVILANNDEGDFGVCLNYMTANPEWFDLRASVNSEVVNDFDFDYGSAFFASGRDASQALGVYVVTTTPVTGYGNIWYFADVLRSNLAEKIASYTLSDDSIETEARILCSESYPLLVLAGFKDGTGTRHGRSTDGGATWGLLTRVGNAITDIAGNDNAPLGMAVSGQYQFISAPDSSNIYGTYRATTAAGAFSKMTGSPDTLTPNPMIAEAIETNDYLFVASSEENAFMTFDSAVDAITWTSDSAPLVYPSVVTSGNTVGVSLPAINVSLGNPFHCWRWNGASGLQTQNHINLDLYVGFSLTVTNIRFDYFVSASGSTIVFRAGNSGSTSFTATNDGAWHSVDWDVNIGATSWAASAAPTLLQVDPTAIGTGAFDIRIDNLEIITNTPFAYADTLYRVSDATGSPSWTNISPSTNEAPARPYDLAVDRVNQNVINFVSGNETDWYTSGNSGSGFTTYASSTPYRALYTQGSSIAAGGLAVAAISLDSGETLADVRGNLSSLWGGSINSIKKLLAV